MLPAPSDHQTLRAYEATPCDQRARLEPVVTPRPARFTTTLVAWARRARTNVVAHGFFTTTESLARSRLWSFVLVASVVSAGVFYVALAWRCEGNHDNDAAYYFGVARAIVRTHRFLEPIVWQYLSPPGHVWHAPFDYWQGLTALLLVPPLALFGDSHRVACLTMALVSATSVVLVARLLVGVFRPRFAVVQIAALVAFALSPAMAIYRFDTETPVVVHVVLLLSLLAWGHRAPVRGVVCAFLLLTVRADTLPLACVLIAANLVLAWHARRLPIVCACVLACAAVLMAVYEILYRCPYPPGVRATASMTEYLDLYAFHSNGHATRSPLWSPPPFAELKDRIWIAWDTLRTTSFLPAQWLWMIVTIVAGVGRVDRRARGQGLLWMLLFACAAAASCARPLLFAAWRSLHGYLPLFVFVAAMGLDEVLARLHAWSRRAGRTAIIAQLVGASLVALLVADTHIYKSPLDNWCHTFETALAAIDARLEGKTVASVRPWFVAANTRSPAVGIPSNGARAIEDVFLRYDVAWLLLNDEDCLGASKAVCDDVKRGARSLGSLAFDVVETKPPLTLYAIHKVAR